MLSKRYVYFRDDLWDKKSKKEIYKYTQNFDLISTVCL